MLGKVICAGALCASLLVAGGGVAGAASSSSCSRSGLVTAGARYRMVGLSAQGLSCARARTVAQKVAGELVHGRPVSISGAWGVSVASTGSCSSCESKTVVALTFNPTGKITISFSVRPSSLDTA